MSCPQYLHSESINPANLLELKVLHQIATKLQSEGNVKGSIPYFAKICQIVDNQRIDGDDTDAKRDALDTIRAQAHIQLADAYFKTLQFTQCESSLSLAVKIFEKQMQRDIIIDRNQLARAYEQLHDCYDALGKHQLADFMDERRQKLLATS